MRITPIMPPVRGLPALVIVVAAVLACGQPASFSLTNAMVDPSYSCPPGSTDTAYDLHATVEAHNGTASSVTIGAATADLTLEAVQGSWLEKVGDRYHAASVTVDVGTVGAGSNATLHFTIPSACTNAKAGTIAASHGDYRVTIHLNTSAGDYSISSSNLHRILAGG